MICEDCMQDKGDDFRKHRKVCRECDNRRAREKRLVDKQREEKEKPATIVCNNCGKETSDFRFNRGTCRDCERAHGRNYRRTTDKAKIWVENNREKMSELQHAWYEKEKTKIRAERAERFKTDPKFRAGMLHRISLSRVLKGQIKKSRHANCDPTRLQDWMQFQFRPGMSLENYSSHWTLDHVIPIHRFLSGEIPQDIVLNWLNVTPVEKKGNLTRNKHATQEECQEHLEKAKLYLKIRKLEDHSGYLQELESFCDNFAKHQVAETALESSDTTLDEKSLRGSRLMPESDGNNSEELADPQART